MAAARVILACLLVLGAIAALGSVAAAQPPGLQPRIDTRLEWAQLRPPPDERLLKLPEDGGASVALKVGGKIFVSGGAIACQPDTAYRIALDLVEPPPVWAQASLEPETQRNAIVRIPADVHQGGWPGPGPSQWSWQEGPSLAIAWNVDDAPSNITYEYRVAGKGEAVLVAGGCHPDPLRQPARHIPETLNVTVPWVAPARGAASQAGCAPGDSTANCARPAAAQAPEESPSLDPVLVLAILALSGMALRRRP